MHTALYQAAAGTRDPTGPSESPWREVTASRPFYRWGNRLGVSTPPCPSWNPGSKPGQRAPGSASFHHRAAELGQSFLPSLTHIFHPLFPENQLKTQQKKWGISQHGHRLPLHTLHLATLLCPFLFGALTIRGICPELPIRINKRNR